MNKKWQWILWIGLTFWMIAEAVEAGAKFAVASPGKVRAEIGEMPMPEIETLAKLLEEIAQYCYDFCKKASPGGYPAMPEDCIYKHCPLWPYRMGKLSGEGQHEQNS